MKNNDTTALAEAYSNVYSQANSNIVENTNFNINYDACLTIKQLINRLELAAQEDGNDKNTVVKLVPRNAKTIPSSSPSIISLRPTDKHVLFCNGSWVRGDKTIKHLIRLLEIAMEDKRDENNPVRLVRRRNVKWDDDLWEGPEAGTGIISLNYDDEYVICCDNVKQRGRMIGALRGRDRSAYPGAVQVTTPLPARSQGYPVLHPGHLIRRDPG